MHKQGTLLRKRKKKINKSASLQMFGEKKLLQIFYDILL